ncbi:hypothetical protein Pd630_LPD01825 [Rhodococcus opacus PD630]|nr:hypothetical protein Pd630_LPD01825 [Rhodococcus opacus PD630]
MGGVRVLIGFPVIRPVGGGFWRCSPRSRPACRFVEIGRGGRDIPHRVHRGRADASRTIVTV